MRDPKRSEAKGQAGAAQTLVDRVRAGIDFATRQVGEKPVRTIGVALAAGYLVGGGLASAFTLRLLGLGVRLAVRAATVPVLAQAAVSFLDPYHPAPNSRSTNNQQQKEA